MEKRRTNGSPKTVIPGELTSDGCRASSSAQAGPARPQLPVRQRVARHSEHPGPHARLHRHEDRPAHSRSQKFKPHRSPPFTERINGTFGGCASA